MKINVPYTEFVLITDKPCILQFEGTTAICLDSISDSMRVFEQGDIYESNENRQIYAKSLGYNGERHIVIFDKNNYQDHSYMIDSEGKLISETQINKSGLTRTRVWTYANDNGNTIATVGEWS